MDGPASVSSTSLSIASSFARDVHTSEHRSVVSSSKTNFQSNWDDCNELHHLRPSQLKIVSRAMITICGLLDLWIRIKRVWIRYSKRSIVHISQELPAQATKLYTCLTKKRTFMPTSCPDSNIGISARVKHLYSLWWASSAMLIISHWSTTILLMTIQLDRALSSPRTRKCLILSLIDYKKKQVMT